MEELKKYKGMKELSDGNLPHVVRLGNHHHDVLLFGNRNGILHLVLILIGDTTRSRMKASTG